MICFFLLLQSVWVGVSGQGFGGETQFSSSEYLEEDVSLYLGPERYSKLYKRQQLHQGTVDGFDKLLMDSISDVFESTDTDKNGELDRQELSSLLGKNKFALQNKEIILQFHKMDENEDGEVSWREYFTKSYSPEFVHQVDKGFIDIEAIDGGRTEYETFFAYYRFKRFNRADLDGSDSLSQSEWVMFTEPREFPHMHQVYLEELVQDIQVDEDYEHVSLEEYKQSVQAAAILKSVNNNAKSYVDKEVAKFQQFDLDNNGKLDRNETREWLFGTVRPDHGHLAKKEVEKYFSILDENKNEKLDFNEIISKSEFLYENIDPEDPAAKEFVTTMDNLDQNITAKGLADLATPEAMEELAREKYESEHINDINEEFAGIDGFNFNAKDERDLTQEDMMYDYDPDFDLSNVHHKWGFVKETQTKVLPGLTLGEYVDEMTMRNKDELRSREEL